MMCAVAALMALVAGFCVGAYVTLVADFFGYTFSADWHLDKEQSRNSAAETGDDSTA